MPAYLEPWLFVQTPKSGSQSITLALEKIAQEKDLDTNVRLWDKKFQHASLKQLKTYEDMATKLPENFKSFGVVRNPFVRAVSVFKYFTSNHKLEKYFGPRWFEKATKFQMLTFKGFWKYARPTWIGARKSFISNYKHLDITCPQHVWLQGCDEVFKIEEPLKIITFLESEFDTEIKSLPQINSQKIKSDIDYKEYYDDESFELIQGFFESDIKIFNYSF